MIDTTESLKQNLNNLSKEDKLNLMKVKTFLNVHEARFYLGVSRSYLYQKIERGDIKRYHLDKKAYFNRNELDLLFKIDEATN